MCPQNYEFQSRPEPHCPLALGCLKSTDSDSRFTGYRTVAGPRGTEAARRPSTARNSPIFLHLPCWPLQSPGLRPVQGSECSDRALLWLHVHGGSKRKEQESAELKAVLQSCSSTSVHSDGLWVEALAHGQPSKSLCLLAEVEPITVPVGTCKCTVFTQFWGLSALEWFKSAKYRPGQQKRFAVSQDAAEKMSNKLCWVQCIPDLGQVLQHPQNGHHSSGLSAMGGSANCSPFTHTLAANKLNSGFHSPFCQQSLLCAFGTVTNSPTQFILEI